MRTKTTGLFYGWVMLGVAVLMAMATMPGQTVLVSLFNESYRNELGISVTQLSAAYTVGTLLAALPISWVGRMADRFGLRLLTALVSVGFALALLYLTQVRGPIMLGLGFFLVRCLGQGCMAMLAGHVIAMWFERRLGMAHSVLSVGGYALASTLTPQPTAWLITEVGWQLALVVLAGFVLVLTLPALLTVFRNRPEDIGQHLDGDLFEHAVHDVLHGGNPPPGDPAFTLHQAVRTRAYWICSLSMVASGLIGTALIFQMTPMLQEAGLAGLPREAALAIQPWPIAFGLVTLVVGWLVDRYRPAPLLALGCLMMGGATVICMLAARGTVEPESTVLLMGVGMGCFGASQAVIVGVASPTIARYFGRTHHGSIRGTVSSAGVAGTGVGPLLAGVGYELGGDSFTALLTIFAVCAVPMAVGSMFLRPPTPPANPDRTAERDEVEPPDIMS
jgi:MFS transporter, OFA family, oxalate/formate antiporter